MDKNGCPPNHFTYNAIIQGLLQHNEISKATEYLQTMVDKGFSADATTATMFVNLLSADQPDKTVQEYF
ncbi:Protein Rf1, mitochondrial [Morella rubra]|uniref:Protein Rf1, mitochondrial n=1 Tax=Morella rubra TaxID=262757 RepID=A0A6A1WNP2_9ROSI|nr:Protein Rf1, mitochondrial [Morella rubra]